MVHFPFKSNNGQHGNGFSPSWPWAKNNSHQNEYLSIHIPHPPSTFFFSFFFSNCLFFLRYHPFVHPSFVYCSFARSFIPRDTLFSSTISITHQQLLWSLNTLTVHPPLHSYSPHYHLPGLLQSAKRLLPYHSVCSPLVFFIPFLSFLPLLPPFFSFSSFPLLHFYHLRIFLLLPLPLLLSFSFVNSPAREQGTKRKTQPKKKTWVPACPVSYSRTCITVTPQPLALHF